MARRKYYKVVCIYGLSGRFTSAWIRDKDWTLSYALGETTWPEQGTGVMVFNTLEQAREWCRRGPDDQDDVILEGTGDRMRLPRVRCHALMGCLDWFDANEVWNGRKPMWDSGDKWPEGTLALRWFKAERIVE